MKRIHVNYKFKGDKNAVAHKAERRHCKVLGRKIHKGNNKSAVRLLKLMIYLGQGDQDGGQEVHGEAPGTPETAAALTAETPADFFTQSPKHSYDF